MPDTTGHPQWSHVPGRQVRAPFMARGRPTQYHAAALMLWLIGVVQYSENKVTLYN